MKLAKVLFVILFIALLITVVLQRLRISGDEALLNSIQSIRPGMLADEVKKVMGREPTVWSGKDPPGWIEDVASQAEVSEFWQYFMGYPSRLLIIGFDESHEVVFVTWVAT